MVGEEVPGEEGGCWGLRTVAYFHWLLFFDDLLSSECTQAIMSDALKRKQLWMKKLEDFKVEGLLALRDVVLATSIEHMARRG